ncbi:MAG: DHH family phosphoesterase [Clostridia bacterium]|nr:DHH family phosphoesterase [Clostridia bacterium]
MKFKDILKDNPFAILLICIATAFSGVTFVFSKSVALVELLIVLLVAVFALKWLADTLQRKIQQVKTLERSLTQYGEADNELKVFPLPVVLVRSTGSIVWFNELFKNIVTEYEDITGNNIRELVNFNENVLEKVGVPFETSNGKSKFTVYSSQTEEDLFALYFIEDTALKDTRHKFNITRPVVLLINTDSLEQTEDSFAHVDYYTINSDVERIITKWLVSYNCIFRKFSDGKFFAITEKENLDAMIQTQFSLLDKVREYSFDGQEIEMTLSVGIGREDTIKECEASARQALDMARGRGGDQIAIKVGENYEFFGGISNRKEKRGKIKSRTVAAALDELIESASNVLIMGHTFSDFDAIGAAVGISAIAKQHLKNVHILVNRQTTLAEALIGMVHSEDPEYKFVDFEKVQSVINNDTLLIVTDTMRSKIVEYPQLLDMKLRTVVIDHHRKPVDFIENASLVFHEPLASSACEMATELVQYAPSKPKLSPAQAQALLAGIILDTKNFTLRVGVRTFEAASYLRDCKADTVAVRKLFASSAEESTAVGKVVSDAEFFGNFTVSVADTDSPNIRLIASKAADELLNINNVDASFVIFEANSCVNISARSLGKINVQLIMEALGGGGHQSMAACQLKDTDISQAKTKLIDAVNSYFDKLKN